MNGGVTWQTLTKELSVEGLVVRFRDASGESILFGKALPLEEMKRETGDEEKRDDGGGGGCNAGWSVLSVLFTLAVLFRMKKARRRN
ncbi:hypothetical protein FACS1894204_02550 [Synergistales bacterium]|nr:hypothetical protein FACS1894204_02550 [Synergistales bacterium]